MSKNCYLGCFRNNFPFIEDTFEEADLYGLVCRLIEEVKVLKKMIDDFDLDAIDEKLQEFKTQIESSVDTKINTSLNEFRIQISADVIENLMNFQEVFNSDLRNLENRLNDKIEQIEVGEIDVYNPVNGQLENINKVLDDIFDLTRNGITCEVFDSLEYTATAFDSLDITAHDFDFNGAEILL